MKTRRRAELMLASMCLIWGTTFSLIRDSVDGTDPGLYLFLRFLIAALFCGVVFRRRIAWRDTRTLKRGLLLGCVLYLGFLFQTIGLVHTSAARSGFLTALYIVMVPLFMSLWKRVLPGGKSLVAALISLGGVALMSGMASGSGSGFNLGDQLTIICAAFFALQILLADALPNRENVWSLHFWQLLTVALLSLPGWLLIGEVRWQPDLQLLISLLFTGILGSVVALGLQLRFQPETTPERAALVYSLEPVFALVAAFILLGERLGVLELAGGGLILVALFLSEDKVEASPAMPE